MRKRIVGLQAEEPHRESDHGWLDLEQIATVEVTSENPKFPIESVFHLTEGQGWRAAEKGDQQIRIIFDKLVSLQRIQLRFKEADIERTQEFVIRWSPASGGAPKEIVRQQWNFSPHRVDCRNRGLFSRPSCGLSSRIRNSARPREA